ncbi:hypothetical protein WJX74_003083 [Apatococcus lobatus]|uniref:Uncharacterized protein n=1 Tax=Apatococcus lobatus TaxID=904363 RepID=A0AAW1RBG7_9CHLO
MALREQDFSDDLTGSLQISRLWTRRLWEALPGLAKDHEYAKMAAIMPKLLCSKDPRLVESKEPRTRLYIGKLLEYGYEPLRSSGICSPEKLQRYLRRMLTFRFGDDNREEVQLELTSLVAEKESLAEADDLAIAAVNFSRKRYAPGPPDPATVAFGGHLAFRLWQQEIKAAANKRQEFEDEDMKAEAEGGWDGSSFDHDAVQWMSSGTKMRDLWNASEQRFQEAWKISAEAADVGWKLAELYCKAGKHRQALEVAKDGAERVPADADLQALLILMAKACNTDAEVRQELAQAHLHLLQDDPFCCSAVAGLLQSKSLLEGEDVLEALLSHLDVCPKVDCFGWQGLADEIDHAHQKAQAEATQAVSGETVAASKELWQPAQHHRPFCQPLAMSPIIKRLLKQPHTDQPSPMRQDSEGDVGAAEDDDDALREDVESGVEEVGARMRCLAFLDADIGSQLSSRLRGIGCSEDADAISALVAFSRSLVKDSAGPPAQEEPGGPRSVGIAGPSFQTASFGHVKRLPPSWWQSFPEIRRKRMRGAEAPSADLDAADMASTDASPG